MAQVPSMPARSHATAPRFDPTQARELRRYWDELESLFDKCGIADDLSRKKWA